MLYQLSYEINILRTIFCFFCAASLPNWSAKIGKTCFLQNIFEDFFKLFFKSRYQQGNAGMCALFGLEIKEQFYIDKS